MPVPNQCNHASSAAAIADRVPLKVLKVLSLGQPQKGILPLEQLTTDTLIPPSDVIGHQLVKDCPICREVFYDALKKRLTRIVRDLCPPTDVLVKIAFFSGRLTPTSTAFRELYNINDEHVKHCEICTSIVNALHKEKES